VNFTFGTMDKIAITTCRDAAFKVGNVRLDVVAQVVDEAHQIFMTGTGKK
jgi:hypothetical protein